MMEYRAGQGKQATSTTSGNSARMRTAAGGNLGMNVSTGGPHLLLFERDQQVIMLLTSEFQLVGYECHTARTAVEVFDTIARHPVRLVLVNLAQAAAGRREFWVALDAQRRGRGVQVLTYRCMNLASYGIEDPDESSQSARPDMAVDGMLGIMNLVDAIRARIPITTMGSSSRIPAVPSAGGQAPSVMSELAMTPPLANPQFPLAAPPSALASLASSPPSPRQQPVPTGPPPQAAASNSIPSYTDKVRAIIYPSQTTWNPPISSQINTTSSPSALQSLQSMYQTSTESSEESSLAQLSRMVRVQQHPPMQNEVVRELRPEPYERPVSNGGQVAGDVHPTASAPLRASPIQDMPIERSVSGQMSAISTGEQSRKAAPSFAREEYSESGSGTGVMERSAFQSPAPIEQVRPGEQEAVRLQGAPLPETNAASDTTLLDIVQSLPPISSLPPQTAVLSGRATRSLGSVLLEGHLVPQNRLEVAQNVQRMLRGVDLNYQLGEILLMFKLLTPDQLLAASLVSYGLISTTQISALGRIRQELHSIGLEYDLENLLILFRILTPEQLREVRSHWA